MIKLVTSEFKPPRSKHNVTKLLDEIEELKERLEEETKRADEAVDKLERFERNDHDEYEVIDREEYLDIERDREILETIDYLKNEIEVTKWRASLGIAGMTEELERLIEELSEVI